MQTKSKRNMEIQARKKERKNNADMCFSPFLKEKCNKIIKSWTLNSKETKETSREKNKRKKIVLILFLYIISSDNVVGRSFSKAI